jgi:putative transposase
MGKQELSYLHYCVFSPHYHLVLVTKYRRKVISNDILERLGEIFDETLRKWECSLIEFNGEEDHVHLLFSGNPNLTLLTLVNNLKTVSSRLIRRDFKGSISRAYREPVFWHRSYCIITSGGAPIEVLKRYIEDQGADQ